MEDTIEINGIKYKRVEDETVEQPKKQGRRRAKKDEVYWYVDWSFDEEQLSVAYKDGIICPINDDCDYLLGNYFATEQEVEDYLAFLKAKLVIEEDAGGYEFKRSGYNYYGWYNTKNNTIDLTWGSVLYLSETTYFKSEEDIEQSQKEHPEEWTTYLKYKLPKEDK